MSRVVQVAAILLLTAILLASGYTVWYVAVHDGRAAIVRDFGMGLSVPIGSVVLLPDAWDYEVGDVFNYYPDPNRRRDLSELFATDTVTRRLIGFRKMDQTSC